jgi:hypothetical protein
MGDEEKKSTIGIVLIDADEILTFGDIETDGYEIDYRRMPLDVAARLQDKNTTMKKVGRREIESVNAGALAADMLKYITLGWRGVGDKKGNALPFDKDLALKLPDEIQSQLLDLSKANAALKELEAKGKN